MTNQPTDNGAQRPREIGYRRLSESLAAEVIYNKAGIDAYLTALEREREDYRLDLGASRKILRYVAFVLTGDEDSDVQLAADEAKQTIATLRAQLDEAVEAYESYVALLNAELNELAGLAAVHGWVSTRFEAGKKARERIAAILTRHAEKGET